MCLFAIGDLHLAGGYDKPMDIFGPQWDRHAEKISENWRSVVHEEDVVLIPGDISWAEQLKDAVPDLEWIGALPGHKILIKGNHDFWWNSISQVRAALPPTVTALQHSAAEISEMVVCGTRGWMIPTGGQPLEEQDRKIYEREAQRLKLALEDAERLARGRRIIVMMHYPPLTPADRENLYTGILAKYPVAAVVYGHLHGTGIQHGFCGEHDGIRYYLASCDSIGFCPVEIREANS